MPAGIFENNASAVTENYVCLKTLFDGGEINFYVEIFPGEQNGSKLTENHHGDVSNVNYLATLLLVLNIQYHTELHKQLQEDNGAWSPICSKFQL